MTIKIQFIGFIFTGNIVGAGSVELKFYTTVNIRYRAFGNYFSIP